MPNSRRGWVSQQAIKVKIGLSTSEIATLVIDADTVLLSPKLWLNSAGNQILCIRYEYHLPYKRHQRQMFGWQSSLFSFVNHHQLMQKSHLISIFGEVGERLEDWRTLGDYSEGSPISEYDTCGEYLVAQQKESYEFSKWNNKSAKIDFNQIGYKKISLKYTEYCSIASHSYL